MQLETIHFALATMFISLCEATALATGKPIGQLSGHLMREMAANAPSGQVDLCSFLADCVENLSDCARCPPSTAH